MLNRAEYLKVLEDDGGTSYCSKCERVTLCKPMDGAGGASELGKIVCLRCGSVVHDEQATSAAYRLSEIGHFKWIASVAVDYKW